MTKFVTILILCTSSLIAFSQTYRSFQENGKYGFKDENEKVIISPQYEYAFDFVINKAVVKNNGRWGFINTNNQVLTSFEYKKCANFMKDVALIQKESGIGLLNSSGDVVVEPVYDAIEILDNELFIVNKMGKHALHGSSKILTDLKYDKIEHLRRSFFSYKIGDKYGVLNSEGHEIGTAMLTRMPYSGMDVLNGDTICYFYGNTEGSKNSTYMSEVGEVFIDGNLFKTLYRSPIHLKICEGNGTLKVVSLHTSEIIVPLEKLEYVDFDWRPCDGYGYEYPPFMMFRRDSNYQLYSVESPKIVFKDLNNLPFLTENLLIVDSKSMEGNSVYTWDGVLIAKNVDATLNMELRERICDDNTIRIMQKGKIGILDSTSMKIKFSKKGSLMNMIVLFGSDVDFNDFEKYKKIFYDKKQNASVYAIYDSNKCNHYLFIDGYSSIYLGKTNALNQMKIHYIETDKNSGVVNVNMDFLEEKHETITYKL